MNQKGKKCFHKWKADGCFGHFCFRGLLKVKIVRDKKDKGRPHARFVTSQHLNAGFISTFQLETGQGPRQGLFSMFSLHFQDWLKAQKVLLKQGIAALSGFCSPPLLLILLITFLVILLLLQAPKPVVSAPLEPSPTPPVDTRPLSVRRTVHCSLY